MCVSAGSLPILAVDKSIMLRHGHIGCRTRRQVRIARSAVWVAAVLICPFATLAGSPEFVVPAYFYPGPQGSPWSDLTAAASRVSVTAILNPASGPGSARDANYVAAVSRLRNAGGRVIGYVPTGFGSRPLDDVFADVDAYRDFYEIDGIFIDEMNNRGAQAVLDFYGEIYSHVKSIDANWEVMGNPGTNTTESFLARPVADRLVITEDVGSKYESFSPSVWVSNYDSAHFVHLVHSEPSAETMQTDIEIAISRNAGALYITDDTLPNPWDRLPGYWAEELATIEGWVSGIDIDLDGEANCQDIDMVTDAVAAGLKAIRFDLDGDGNVNLQDRNLWLTAAGERNLGRPYQLGDVNLDGTVDGLDLGVVESNLFTVGAQWCAGNLNADGVVDGSDFNLLFDNGVVDNGPRPSAAVAEPSSGSTRYVIPICLLIWLRSKLE